MIAVQDIGVSFNRITKSDVKHRFYRYKTS